MTDYMAGFTNGLSEDDLKLTEEYEPFDNENVPCFRFWRTNHN